MRQQNLLHEKNKAAKQQRGRFLFVLPPLNPDCMVQPILERFCFFLLSNLTQEDSASNFLVRHVHPVVSSKSEKLPHYANLNPNSCAYTQARRNSGIRSLRLISSYFCALWVG